MPIQVYYYTNQSQASARQLMQSADTCVGGHAVSPSHLTAAVPLFFPTDRVFLTGQKGTALKRIRHLHHPVKVMPGKY